LHGRYAISRQPWDARSVLQRARSDKGSFKLPIKRIVVGPSPHRDLNAASVKAMLAASGIEGIDVETSKTPFRA